MKVIQIAGFLIGGLGFAALMMGGSAAFPFMLLGGGLIVFSLFSGGVSSKLARKELMELKTLLDKGIITSTEFEEKSKALKNKI